MIVGGGHAAPERIGISSHPVFPQTLPGPSRRRLWLIAATLATVLVAVISLTHAAAWLIVSDPLQPASAVAVFGGGLPFRAMGAGRLYNDGWARQVWLTDAASNVENEMLKTMGIERRPEHVDSRKVLEHMGVPPESIRVIPGRPRNTEEEVRVIADALRASGGDTVILVTSKYHTRRVRALWHSYYRSSPAAVVRFAPDDRFEPERWWRESRSAEAVVHEWFGILFVWVRSPWTSLQ